MTLITKSNNAKKIVTYMSGVWVVVDPHGHADRLEIQLF